MPKGVKGSRAKAKSLFDESVPVDSPFLGQLIDLLVSISPDYPGFPSQTLKDKILKDNYSLTKHEKIFLLTSLKAVEKLAFELRLNDLSTLVEDINQKIQKAELDAEVINQGEKAKSDLFTD